MPSSPRRTASFNPHPAQKQSATPKKPKKRSRSSGFNPHPAQKQSATRARRDPGSGSLAVSIPTLLKSRVQPHRGRWRGWRLVQFQSPPCSKAECNRCAAQVALSGPGVSIPTLLKSRVQPAGSRDPTRRKPSSFNPHPAQKQSATCKVRYAFAEFDSFNPHPAQKQSATRVRAGQMIGFSGVSIPTLLKSRVQLPSGLPFDQRLQVSIPTLLKSRVQHGATSY